MRNLPKNGFLLTIVAVLSLTTLKAEAALFVAGRGNGSVLRYDDQTGAFIDTFIPAGRGGLVGPSSLAFGPDNNLYISDYYSSSVLKYDGQTGAFIDTFVSSGSGGIANPESIAFGPDNNLYVSGLEGSGIRRYDGKTGAFIDTVVAIDPSTGNKLNAINFAFGLENNLYFSSFVSVGEGKNSVLRYDNQTGITDTFIPGSLSPAIAGGVTFGLDNNLYVTDFAPNASIRRYDGETGALIDTFVPSGRGGLNQASRLIFRPDNNLYVTSFGGDSVLRYNGQTGAFIDAFIPSGSGGLHNPIGLAFSVTPVPEPTYCLGLLGFGAYFGTKLVLKSQQKKRSIFTTR